MEEIAIIIAVLGLCLECVRFGYTIGKDVQKNAKK